MPKFVKTLTLLLFLSAVITVGGLNARSGYLGVQPAYPQEISWTVPAEKQPVLERIKRVLLVCAIDETGAITAVTPENPADSLLAAFTRLYLNSFTFVPGSVDGSASATSLAIEAWFSPKRRIPQLFFPVDTTGQVLSRDLFERTLSLNSVSIPKLKRFDRFFAKILDRDSLVLPPYVLVKVQLDSTGQPLESELAATDFSNFAQQIANSAMWAEYEPAVVNGVKVASEPFLLVTFYPEISYPTLPYDVNSSDSLSLLKQLQVQLFADTVGMMRPAVPASHHARTLTYSRKTINLPDTVVATLIVDRNGRGRVGNISSSAKKTTTAVRFIISQLKFYPAVDYQGVPQTTENLIGFKFDGSPSVRITYYWLNHR